MVWSTVHTGYHDNHTGLYHLQMYKSDVNINIGGIGNDVGAQLKLYSIIPNFTGHFAVKRIQYTLAIEGGIGPCVFGVGDTQIGEDDITHANHFDELDAFPLRFGFIASDDNDGWKTASFTWKRGRGKNGRKLGLSYDQALFIGFKNIEALGTFNCAMHIYCLGKQV